MRRDSRPGHDADAAGPADPRSASDRAARRTAVLAFLAAEGLIDTGGSVPRRLAGLSDLVDALASRWPERTRWVLPDPATLWRWAPLGPGARAAAPGAGPGDAAPDVGARTADGVATPSAERAPAANVPRTPAGTPASGGEPLDPGPGVRRDPATLTADAPREALVAAVEAMTAVAEGFVVELRRAGNGSLELTTQWERAKQFRRSMRRREASRRQAPWTADALVVRIRSLAALHAWLLRAVERAQAGRAVAPAPTPATLRAGTPDAAPVTPSRGRAGPPDAETGAPAPGATSGDGTGRDERPPARLIRLDVGGDPRLPIYQQPRNPGDPEAPSLVEELRHAAVAPYNAVVGSVGTAAGAAAPGVADAHARAALIAPILDGQLTVRGAAAAWQRANRGAPLPTDPELDLGDASAREKYLDVGESSLRAMVAKVRTASAQAAVLGLPSPAVVDVLRHRQPEHRVGRLQVEDAVLLALVKEFAKGRRGAGPNAPFIRFSASALGRLLKDRGLADVSDRTVQRWIAEHGSDVERALGRAGAPARGLLFGTRLIREAAYPNRAWLIDNSWFAAEVDPGRDPERDATLRRARPFDFDLPCERRTVGRGGRVRVHPVRRLCMTLIIDACTRHRLALRCWDGAPSAATTLLAILDAVLRYGLPDIIYSDNGSEFRNGAVGSAVRNAGIHQIFSRPGDPAARGRIERTFRSVKDGPVAVVRAALLGHVPFAGLGTADPEGAGVDGPRPADLTDVQRMLREQVARLDEEPHAETGRPPRVHFEQAVGERGVLTAAQRGRALLSLTPYVEAVRRVDGLHADGLRYVGGGTQLIGVGKCARIYRDEYAPRLGHLVAADSKGNLRYVSPVRAYAGTDAPDPLEWRRFEAEWRASQGVEYVFSGRRGAGTSAAPAAREPVEGTPAGDAEYVDFEVVEDAAAERTPSVGRPATAGSLGAGGTPQPARLPAPRPAPTRDTAEPATSSAAGGATSSGAVTAPVEGVPAGPVRRRPRGRFEALAGGALDVFDRGAGAGGASVDGADDPFWDRAGG